MEIARPKKLDLIAKTKRFFSISLGCKMSLFCFKLNPNIRDMEIARPKKYDRIAKTERLILSFPYLWGVNKFILFEIES